jgi:hypothetical protein
MAWQQGRKELFYPYGKTYAELSVSRNDVNLTQTLAHKDEGFRSIAGTAQHGSFNYDDPTFGVSVDASKI